MELSQTSKPKTSRLNPLLYFSGAKINLLKQLPPYDRTTYTILGGYNLIMASTAAGFLFFFIELFFVIELYKKLIALLFFLIISLAIQLIVMRKLIHNFKLSSAIMIMALPVFTILFLYVNYEQQHVIYNISEPSKMLMKRV